MIWGGAFLRGIQHLGARPGSCAHPASLPKSLLEEEVRLVAPWFVCVLFSVFQWDRSEFWKGVPTVWQLSRSRKGVETAVGRRTRSTAGCNPGGRLGEVGRPGTPGSLPSVFPARWIWWDRVDFQVPGISTLWFLSVSVWKSEKKQKAAAVCLICVCLCFLCLSCA